jgi:hypothetical protein
MNVMRGRRANKTKSAALLKAKRSANVALAKFRSTKQPIATRVKPEAGNAKRIEPERQARAPNR